MIPAVVRIADDVEVADVSGGAAGGMAPSSAALVAFEVTFVSVEPISEAEFASPEMIGSRHTGHL